MTNDQIAYLCCIYPVGVIIGINVLFVGARCTYLAYEKYVLRGPNESKS